MISGKDFDIVEELEFKFTNEIADLVFESMKIKEQMKNEKINNHEKEMYKMTNVYDEQVLYLKELVPDFKVANATIHFDESSPHLHIVGIAVKENCKTGMSKQVGKCSVFTKDNLSKNTK